MLLACSVNKKKKKFETIFLLLKFSEDEGSVVFTQQSHLRNGSCVGKAGDRTEMFCVFRPPFTNLQDLTHAFIDMAKSHVKVSTVRIFVSTICRCSLTQ